MLTGYGPVSPRRRGENKSGKRKRPAVEWAGGGGKLAQCRPEARPAGERHRRRARAARSAAGGGEVTQNASPCADLLGTKGKRGARPRGVHSRGRRGPAVTRPAALRDSGGGRSVSGGGVIPRGERDGKWAHRGKEEAADLRGSSTTTGDGGGALGRRSPTAGTKGDDGGDEGRRRRGEASASTAARLGLSGAEHPEEEKGGSGRAPAPFMRRRGGERGPDGAA